MQALQSERASLQAQLQHAHPAEAQRLRSEVDTLHARLGQLDTVKVRCLLPPQTRWACRSHSDGERTDGSAALTLALVPLQTCASFI